MVNFSHCMAVCFVLWNLRFNDIILDLAYSFNWRVVRKIAYNWEFSFLEVDVEILFCSVLLTDFAS